MNDINPAKFEKARIEAEEFYKKIGYVRCPFFKEYVAFNAKGIEHIKFNRIRQARPHRVSIFDFG